MANYCCVCVIFVLVILITTNEGVQIFLENGEILSDKDITLNPEDNITIICSGDKYLKWITPNVPAGMLTPYVFSEMDYGMHAKKLLIQEISYPFVGNYTCQGSTTSTSVYLFVRDENNLAVNMDELNIEESSHIIIPCRPTFPEVRVELVDSDENLIPTLYDPKMGLILDNYTFDIQNRAFYYQCIYSLGDVVTQQYINIIMEEPLDNEYDVIKEENEAHNIIGQTLTLTCQVQKNIVNFIWKTPSLFDESRMKIVQNSGDTYTGRKLIINPTIPSDNGTYECIVYNRRGRKEYFIDVKLYEPGESFLWINKKMGLPINVTAMQPSAQWNIEVRGHPHPKIKWFNNKKELIENGTKKYVTKTQGPRHYLLQINNLTLNDFGTYSLEARSGNISEKLDLFLNITDKPRVALILDEFHHINSVCKVQCVAKSNPPPVFKWKYKECEQCEYKEKNEMLNENIHDITYVSTLTINVKENGFIQCIVNNSIGTTIQEVPISVTDVDNGFDIFNFDELMNINENKSSAEVAIGETLSMTCAVSAKTNTDLQWFINNQLLEKSDDIIIERSYTKYSNRTSLLINNINESMAGNYKCETKSKKHSKTIEIIVSKPTQPWFDSKDETVSVSVPLPFQIFCNVSGVPKPTIKWMKNSKPFEPLDTKAWIMEDHRYLSFSKTEVEDEGTYTCVAHNSQGTAEKRFSVNISNKPPSSLYLYIIIVVILIASLILVVFLTIHIRREKLLQKELKEAGLAHFQKGQAENINPDLGIDEQADLLPYDKKWEFPVENLCIEKQLGSGAFGVVKKAVAKNIIPGEDKTIVAVKMVKKTADNLHIRALATELKIMVHLGQHLNVVNLLGAVTTNVARRELMVIVEYCRYGNLQNFLLRHRGSYINQLDPVSGNVDYTIGLDILERAHVSGNRTSNRSYSYTPRTANSMADYRGSDYGNNQTGVTEMTNISLNSAGYVDRNGSRHNSVNPLWRSNMTGDYKNTAITICTRDLISWAFQIARGMGYLASRKVLHGDLAARNVLLADNNIVKICDFGLAKTMYKDDNYMKKGDGPLPIKWMAIESIRDKIFSTQSDVWSFGITCWEIFSLGRNPYPGFNIDNEFLQKLLSGYRMEQPEYSPRNMYKIMYDCWMSKPTDRPTFSQLEEDIGALLEDSMKQHYVALNDPYMEMNTQRQQLGETDYLRMMNSPDFRNLSSPGGNDGYLTPTLFGARPQNINVFNFDVDSNISSSESTGHEMQPMLHTVVESDNEAASPTPDSFANPSYHIVSPINNSDDSYMNMSGSSKENKKEVTYLNSTVV
ncbi:vascular endothelial growth factor receptor 1 isoform X3 [Aethina tumida]|uniref:vascular endothelial growth factor receptor 1 isoform X3 n=1 Tax=Aethina tumida TaxID=116153 RepID=UPI0021484D1C|nr:vascular endothelial growth factor receptor 1 isoform X3 [Aethina tumida]